MFRIIGRRWRVSVPAIILTVLAAATAYVKWPTTYQSTAQLSLLGSTIMTSQPASGRNPYAAVGSLTPMASILASSLSSDQAGRQLKALGMTNGFTAVVPPFAAGPFIALTVSGHSSSSVWRSMPVVIRFAEQRLRQLQASGAARTPAAGRIRAIVIAPAGTPVTVMKTKIELVAGVAIAGLVVMLLLSFGAEGRALRRAGHRNAPAATPMLTVRSGAEAPRQEADDEEVRAQ